MNTPVASKKQKKVSAKKGLRNVLAQPYKKYWPVLAEDEQKPLEDLLNRLLPGLKRESHAVPWSQLRKMEKAERLVAQKKARMETQEDINGNSNLKAVTMGVNAVTRDLEKDDLSCVVLDSCVESLLVKHVVVMAQNKEIPILLVPFLKKVTLENVGFATAAMGLKHEVTEPGHYFHEIHQKIVKCSPPIPSAQKCLSTKSPKVVDQDTTEDMKMLTDENSSPKTRLTVSTNVYKYRTTLKERAFVPPGTDEKVVADKEWSDFIAIGNDDVEMEVEKDLFPRKKRRYMDSDAGDNKNSKPDGPESSDYISFGSTNDESSSQVPENHTDNNKTTYLPLKVKRVQGNVNRVKATKTPKQKKKSSTNKS